MHEQNYTKADSISSAPAPQPFYGWNLAALTWLFFPGGDTNPGQIDFSGADSNFTAAITQFEQVIKPTNPGVIQAINDVRSKIAALTATDGALGSIWGYSGVIKPDLVVEVSNA
jgi:hypothetical protein